jgi:predicted permease
VVVTDATLAGYQPAQQFSLYRELSERLKELPGVQSATLAQYTPASGTSSSGNFSIQGYTPLRGKKLDAWYVQVGTDFFETLKIPVRLGRVMNERDTPASTPVTVVNETFVKEYLAGKNPLGVRIEHGAPFKAPGSEIVGVVADSKFFDLREKPKPMAFYPMTQKPVTTFELVLRIAADPNSVVGEVRRMLNRVNSRLPVLEVNTLDQQVEHSLEQQKMITTLCSTFGVLALLLASIGIYGSLAYSVSGRTAEIGIRMAIGAQRASVVWLVLRDLLILMIAGLVAGVPFALGGTRWLKSFLFGIGTVDPLALAAAVLLILFVALLAGYLPARRAARIDPMRALRHE